MVISKATKAKAGSGTAFAPETQSAKLWGPSMTL
jgi:hypothetical protein